MKTMLSDKYVDLIADHGWELCSGYAAFAGTQEDPVLESPVRESVNAALCLVATGSAPGTPWRRGVHRFR
ncbi:hypothetical protein ACQCSU_04380 [Pseudarthrobacter sp. O4]|uniref:hypothetical protein n=1 Tax=Pseudarthrobacter sp. O4 TaxID=3418417 RepID=UPI003CE7D3B3